MSLALSRCMPLYNVVREHDTEESVIPRDEGGWQGKPHVRFRRGLAAKAKSVKPK